MPENTHVDWSREIMPGERKPRRGDVLVVDLVGFDAKGRALGTCGEFRVELRGGVPGARVRAEVTKRRGQRIRARLIEVLEPSPREVAARCEHFGTCGGCSLQAMDYDAQLEHLREQVVAAFAAEGMQSLDVLPVLPCAEPWPIATRWISPSAHGVGSKSEKLVISPGTLPSGCMWAGSPARWWT